MPQRVVFVLGPAKVPRSEGSPCSADEPSSVHSVQILSAEPAEIQCGGGRRSHPIGDEEGGR